jgi:hypothetical protein
LFQSNGATEFNGKLPAIPSFPAAQVAMASFVRRTSETNYGFLNGVEVNDGTFGE